MTQQHTYSLTALTSQYGVSDSLKAMFEGLRETPGLTGDKFRRADVNKFAQYIVCRNYGKLCLELSYLLYSVVKYQHKSDEQDVNKDKLLSFFWINEYFSPKRFRQYFAVNYSDSKLNITLSEQNLTLDITGKKFSISPTRAGVLAVLFEFLMMIDPSIIESIEQSFSEPEPDEKAIKQYASTFQKLLYEFLSEHLSSAQTQRRFRFITQWLHSQHYDEQFLTDETILTFWQMASTSDTSLSFKLYSSVFFDLIGVDQAIKQTQQMHEVEQHLTLGDSNHVGELSADVLYQQLFDQVEHEKNYNFLIESPKFLTKTQWQQIALLIDYEQYNKKLALSFARQAIFSPWQASIVQAKRKSKHELVKKLNDLPTSTYVIHQVNLAQLIQNIDDVLSSIVYIYLQLRISEGISGVLSLLPAHEMSQIKANLQQKLSIKMKEAKHDTINEKQLFQAFNEILVKSPPIKVIEQHIKKAFNNNNKLGFKEIPDRADVDIYREGQSALEHCKQLISKQLQLYRTFWESDDDCQENFSSDAFIFKQSFEEIYLAGETNDC